MNIINEIFLKLGFYRCLECGSKISKKRSFADGYSFACENDCGVEGFHDWMIQYYKSHNRPINTAVCCEQE